MLENGLEQGDIGVGERWSLGNQGEDVGKEQGKGGFEQGLGCGLLVKEGELEGKEAGEVGKVAGRLEGGEGLELL